MLSSGRRPIAASAAAFVVVLGAAGCSATPVEATLGDKSASVRPLDAVMVDGEPLARYLVRRAWRLVQGTDLRTATGTLAIACGTATAATVRPATVSLPNVCNE